MASETAKHLRDKRNSDWEKAKAILDRADTEKRSLTDEEDREFNAYNDEIDKTDTRLKTVLDSESRSREVDAAYNALAGKPQGRADENSFLGEVRSWAMQRDGAKSYMVVNRSNAMGPLNLRSLQSNTTNGSATVPTDFYDQLIAYLIEVSGILQTGPSVLTTQGGETIQVPRATQHVTATTAAQAGNLPTADAVFDQKTLGAQKFAALTHVSRELIDDTGVDILGYLARTAGRAIGNSFGSALVLGGNGISGGLIPSLSVAVTGGVTSAISAVGAPTGGATYENLVDLEYSVIAPYRQSKSCYWLAADATIGSLRKLKDTTGRPLWEPSPVLGSPDLLLGKPIVADPFVAAYATAAKSIAFGDFSNYFIRLVGGLRFERSDDFLFGSDLVSFRSILRGDGTLADANSIKLFQGGAS